MDSLKHDYKIPFYEKKRKKYDCDYEDFIEGLKVAFKKIDQIGYHELTEDEYAQMAYGLNPINLKPDELESLSKDLEEYYLFLRNKVNISNSEKPNQFEFTIQDDDNINQTLSEIENSENKFWKGFPMKKVVQHFRVLTEKKSDNGEVYLTSPQLIAFLKKGFLGDDTQPVQKINCSSGEKGLVILRFYEFYDLAVAQYQHQAKKENFINLFSDCFDNWEKDTIIPFFKRGKTKQKW